jgi:hypothetical protein
VVRANSKDGKRNRGNDSVSIELKDFRGKITPETSCWLEAEARATGKQQQEIAREALHELALVRIKAATVLRGLMLAEGLAGEDQGRAGRGGE